MTKAIVLGGCGAVGSNAVKTLVNTDTLMILNLKLLRKTEIEELKY